LESGAILRSSQFQDESIQIQYKAG
jgi:hypothetical protein